MILILKWLLSYERPLPSQISKPASSNTSTWMPYAVNTFLLLVFSIFESLLLRQIFYDLSRRVSAPVNIRNNTYPNSATEIPFSLKPFKPRIKSHLLFDGIIRAHHFLHVSRIRVKLLAFRRLMSYIYIYIYLYGAPILDVSRSHTTTQHIR